MNRLRNRLIAIFLLATLLPLALTVWVTTSLLDRSLRFASTNELDATSQSLAQTGRVVYQQTRDQLDRDIAAGRAKRDVVTGERDLGEYVVEGDQLRFYRSESGQTVMYSRPLGVDLQKTFEQYRNARSLVDQLHARDLRRGFFVTIFVVVSGIWLISGVALVFFADRISRPIHQLTGGLARLSRGDLDVRLAAAGTSEIAQATDAFNNTAAQLRRSQDRLIYLTQLESWQLLARKMAHEVKNSLTPVRLTMEELMVRNPDDAFLTQAAGIVIDEVVTLERRVRAFSEFAAEPPVRLNAIDIHALMQERVSLLGTMHPDITYELQLQADPPCVSADEDLIKSVLTNLLENAADAAAPGGTVRLHTKNLDDRIQLEIHDSGPGLSRHARESLFQPTISFKKSGMGLGLSIAKRSALLSGGTIELIEGELGGAAFAVTLPLAKETCPQNESSSSTMKKTSVARYA